MGDSLTGPNRPVAVLLLGLIGTGACFRLLYLSSMPGISGDEGWWGMQALAWSSGQPYEAHTTSGNPTDLFFLVPLAFVHTLAPPSFLLLRAVPAFVNLLALPIGFWLVRRAYGSTTAWIHTVILAILPTAIAHSRICQDPSQTVFWTGLVIYLALLGFDAPRRSWIYRLGAVVAFPVALWTHPTNVFIAPFLAIPFLPALRPRLPASRLGRAGFALAAMLLVILGLSLAGTALAHLADSNPYLNKPWLAVAAARLADSAQWYEFAANNVRLLNGLTIYHYFSGAQPPALPHDAGFVLAAVAILAGLLLVPAGRRRPLDGALLLACAGTWLAFYAFAGPQALRPHVERWGLCLLVPASLVASRGLSEWIEWGPGIRRWPLAAVAVAATGLLGSFYVNYFRVFATTGGRSHLTYVTAATEPKQQALAHVLAASTGPEPVQIVAQQWWLFWPTAYLATVHPRVTVTPTLPDDRQPGLDAALDAGRLFFVEFVGTPEAARATAWIRQRDLRADRTTIRDAGGRDLLEILRVAAQR
ncbi:MAG TPA: hypothetical protein VD833_19670 [Vicinamibacterales bacterium]|nr:hypothetical protein [Vicinamibacterales bacterium]